MTPSERGLLRRAQVALAAGDPRGSERLALQIITRNRHNADAWFVLGDALLAADEPDRAARQIATGLDFLAPKIRLLAYLFVVACHQLGQLEPAKPWLPFISMDPTLWDDLGRETNYAFIADAPVRTPDRRPEIT